MPSRIVRPGEPFSMKAEEFNSFGRAADLMQAIQAGMNPGASAGLALDRQSCVLVKNTAGLLVPRFGVLVADGPIFSPSDNELEFINRAALKGAYPDAPAGARAVLVAQEPIADDRIGRCVISGMSVATINVTDADHEFADLTSGSLMLASAETGPMRVVWKPSGTGEKICLVLVNQSAAPAAKRIRVKITTPVAISGATATVGGTSQAVRWTYTLTQYRWDYATQANVAVSGGVSVEGATNENEDGNNSTKLGPGYLISEIRTGWKYLAAGKCGASNSDCDCFHEAWQEIDPTDGTISWRFNHVNQLGGTC